MQILSHVSEMPSSSGKLHIYCDTKSCCYMSTSAIWDAGAEMTWSDWALLGPRKTYFVKGREGKNIENISKREMSSQICCYHSCRCCFYFALDTPMHAGPQAGFLALYAAAQGACHPLYKSDSFLSTLPFCAPPALLCVPGVRDITWTILAFW